MLAIDLFANLQRITPIGEDRGFLGKHNRATRRPAKACEPPQTLRIFADIFAHMLIANRHDKAVQTVCFQLFAQCGKAGFIGGHVQFLFLDTMPI